MPFSSYFMNVLFLAPRLLPHKGTLFELFADHQPWFKGWIWEENNGFILVLFLLFFCRGAPLVPGVLQDRQA